MKTEWVSPKQKDYKFCCCDCGLIHKMEFRVVFGMVNKKPKLVVQFLPKLDEKATNKYRKKNDIKITYF